MSPLASATPGRGPPGPVRDSPASVRAQAADSAGAGAAAFVEPEVLALGIERLQRTWRRVDRACCSRATTTTLDDLGRRAAHTRSAEVETVLAAASLAQMSSRDRPGAIVSFGGSNQLAQQVRQGFQFDVFLSASPSYTQSLFADGLVRKPVDVRDEQPRR